MFKIINKLLKLFLIFLIIGLLFKKLIDINFFNSSMFFEVTILLIFMSILIWLYKRKFISKRFLYISLAFIFILGIIFRIHFINVFVMELAQDLDNNKLFLFLYFNLFWQILSMYFLFKIINLHYSKETAFFLSTLYFVIPSMIFCNLIVSFSSLKILLFFIFSYILLKYNNDSLHSVKNFLIIFLLCCLLFLSIFIFKNFLIFVSILGICYLLTIKKFKELFLAIFIVFTLFLFNSIFDINIKNEFDKLFILDSGNTEILIEKTSLLTGDTYRLLNKNSNLIYSFENANDFIIIILSVLSILSLLKKIKNDSRDMVLLEICTTLYVLLSFILSKDSQFYILICPFLLICSSGFLEEILIPKSVTKPYFRLKKITTKNPKVLLIIPAYNEEEVIKETVENVLKHKIDYIIINDGSTDQTEKICIENKFNYLTLVSNLGIGGAVQAGYKYALKNDYDIAIQFDSDGQHDINYIDDIIKPIVSGDAHFVIGSRFVKGSTSEFKSTKMRQIGIKLISWLINKYADQRIYDTTSGFRAANKDVIKEFAKNYPTEYPEPISSFRLLKLGYTIKEVPVKMFERLGGKSSIISWKKAYYMFNVFFSIIIEQLRSEEK